MKINQIFPRSDWQKFIQINEQANQSLLMGNFELNKSNMYEYFCKELKAYLNNNNLRQTFNFFPRIANYDNFDYANQDAYIPSIKELAEKFSYTVATVLTRIEIWITSRLNQCINHPTIYFIEMNLFETLLHFFEEYQSAALNHY
ncbi:unnamed protein product [Rotaria sp. Silwood2]|nr:unnamed protein product [Rotaria sp. Silwood2]